MSKPLRKGSVEQQRAEALTPRETADLVKMIAIDLPDHEEFAIGILMAHPHIARELLGASKGANGWRVYSAPGFDDMVADMRTLGLVEAAGLKPSPEAIAAGRGFHLSAYGLAIRRILLRMKNEK